MIVPITQEKWERARRALTEASERFVGLASETSGSVGKATDDWSVAETVAHVGSLGRTLAGMVDPDGGRVPVTDIDTLIHSTIVDTVDQFNEVLLGELTERDPRELGRRLHADFERVLIATADADPAQAVPWLGGSKVPLAGLFAHMINELNVHGWDIARAARVPWRVPPEEAALFFDVFLLGVTHYGYGRLLDGHGPAPKGRVAVQFSSRYTTTRVMAMHDGFVTVEKPGDGPVDVKLSFDPVTLNLMLFGRVSKPRAALTGKVVIRGGRRPWTLPSFLRIVKLPS